MKKGKTWENYNKNETTGSIKISFWLSGERTRILS